MNESTKPDSTALRDATCFISNKSLESIPLIGSVLSGLSGIVCSKLEANDKYRKLLPILREVIRMKGRNSDEANTLINMIGELPSWGARRNFFKKRYIDDPNGWGELPDDPNRIPSFAWYP